MLLAQRGAEHFTLILERQSVGAGILCLLRAVTTAISSHSCAGCRNYNPSGNLHIRAF